MYSGSGCPAASSGRRKRSVSDCSELIAYESTMPDALLEQICDFDGSVDPNLVNAAQLASMFLADAQGYDQSFFSNSNSQFVSKSNDLN